MLGLHSVSGHFQDIDGAKLTILTLPFKYAVSAHMTPTHPLSLAPAMSPPNYKITTAVRNVYDQLFTQLLENVDLETSTW